MQDQHHPAASPDPAVLLLRRSTAAATSRTRRFPAALLRVSLGSLAYAVAYSVCYLAERASRHHSDLKRPVTYPIPAAKRSA